MCELHDPGPGSHDPGSHLGPEQQSALLASSYLHYQYSPSTNLGHLLRVSINAQSRLSRKPFLSEETRSQKAHPHCSSHFYMAFLTQQSHKCVRSQSEKP